MGPCPPLQIYEWWLGDLPAQVPPAGKQATLSATSDASERAANQEEEEAPPSIMRMAASGLDAIEGANTSAQASSG